LLTFSFVVLRIGNDPFKFVNSNTLSIATKRRCGFLCALALLLLSPLIVVSFRYALDANLGSGTLAEMVWDPTIYHSIYTNTTGYLVDANIMMGGLAVGIAWGFRFRLFALIPFAAYSLLRMSIGGGRWTFLMAAASLGLLFMFDRRALWLKWKPLLLVPIVLFLFTQIGLQRAYVANWILGRESISEPDDRQYFDNMDFANLEYLQYIVHVVPNRTGTYDYFLNNLELLTAPFPRILWPEKPVGPPIRLFNIFDYGFPIGITWSVIGEGWKELGAVGVVLWCAMGGLLWGTLYRAFVRSKRGSFQVLVYIVLLPLSVQWFRDGGLLTLVKFSLFPLLGIGVAVLLGKIIPIARSRIPLAAQRQN
jgi:hypothetical protein